jgi:hypothetical protein
MLPGMTVWLPNDRTNGGKDTGRVWQVVQFTVGMASLFQCVHTQWREGLKETKHNEMCNTTTCYTNLSSNVFSRVFMFGESLYHSRRNRISINSDKTLHSYYLYLKCTFINTRSGLKVKAVCSSEIVVLSAYQEKIPARNAIYAHAQDFSAGDEMLLAILKAFIPQPLNKQQTKVFHVFWWIQCDSM